MNELNPCKCGNKIDEGEFPYPFNRDASKWCVYCDRCSQEIVSESREAVTQDWNEWHPVVADDG